MDKAVIIKTDGSRHVVEFKVGESYQLLSDTVGGMIECIRLRSRGVDMWINDEGKYRCEFQNPQGTAFYHNEFGAHDYIMGDIILTQCDDEGETIGLTDEQIKFFMETPENLVLMSVPVNPAYKF